MAFTTDGRVHHGGISNERRVIDRLNELSLYPVPVTHKGGTKSKADAVAGEKGISIKRKQGAKVGSFDWLNTTRIPQEIASQFDGFRSLISEMRQLPEADRHEEIDAVRDLFNRTASAAFDALTSEQLLTLLQTTFAKQAGFDIVVSDTLEKRLHIFKADELPILSLIEKGYTPELIAPRNENQTSRKLVMRKGSKTVDCGIRLRITSNNGISAFLGLSKSNSNSSVVFKLQQDAVDKLLYDVVSDVYTF